jgi:hypothetical protein
MERLRKSDVPWVLSMLSLEDQMHFSRSWFVVDCKRRYRQLEKDESKLLGCEKLLGIVKMFPILSLDFDVEGRCIEAVDKDLPNFLAVFDTDGDGLLSESDFEELLRFCHGWRSSFYIKQSRPSSTQEHFQKDSLNSTIGRPLSPKSPALHVAAKGILQQVNTGAKRSASHTTLVSKSKEADTAAKTAAQPGPKMIARRGSGFGPRVLMLPELESPPQQRAQEAQDACEADNELSPQNLMKEKKDEASKESREFSRGRRRSAPELDFNFRADVSRGGFYSSLSGFVNMFGSQSRESSTGFSAESEDD